MLRNRDVPIHIRVTEQEKRKIERNARRCSLSLSAFLRRMGAEQEMLAFPQKEMYQIYKKVNTLLEGIQIYPRTEIEEKLLEVRQEILNVYLNEMGEDTNSDDEDLADT